MPYVFKEVLDEGEVEADVVPREDHQLVLDERDSLTEQRDALLERAETAEQGWRDARNKYADAFITSPQRIKEENHKDVRHESSPRTFDQLFSSKGENNAY
jgi:hypothetical protein